MKNIKLEVKDRGKTLVITVDLTQNFGPSKSGKTIVIASTEGNVTPPGGDEDTKVGVNVYRYP